MIPEVQKGPVMMAVMGDLAGPVPSLDLGKKLSVPQDLMMEELSLRNNRGSLLFQKRQRRVQKFTFELAASQREMLAGSAKRKVTGTVEPGTVANGPGPEGQNYRSELHILPASAGGPEDAHAASVAAAAPAQSARSPSALAPGYAEPLKGVPPEKFNHTAIPKGYRCPWQEFISYRDYLSDLSHTHRLADYRNFNKTPVPFGGPFVRDIIPTAGTPFIPEPFNGLELLRRRPSFNRVAQGWVRNLPESEDL
ncbi:myozenin-3 [Otolemur garnettii]|uniref:Myozenin 3 n=1 Tax=Otolemur garnettii TaxID=30611 RepID=H0X424_OTOGA|nr:myozenin-3 [Otolemur garnettii]